jgi:catechol 2,3-dioxygenase
MLSSFEMTRRAVLYFMSAAPLTLAADGLASSALAAPAPSFAVTTPIHINSVSLRVRDIKLMTGFYSQVIGLDLQSTTASESVLGKDGVALVRLLAKPDDQPDDQVSAGLYHTAFLMPDRKELGRWLITAYVNGVPFTGFADHHVSEALYLNDPEGNGVEVYADRPNTGWSWSPKGEVVMGTDQLNVDDLVAGLPRDGKLPYNAPSGFRIGHVHMRVGDTAVAQDFYIKAAGLDLTALIAGESAAFFSNGRYHHHIGANVWQSRGAGARPQNMSGLADAAFSVQPALMDGLRARLKAHGTDMSESGDIIEAMDPWGTPVRFVPA